ncbi:MFS transporter [Dactylosporangium sp. NPDC050588]|uniref:MFS transporter n=1 Tax=Dactylosporangium sp. NPDC050588 TaxID=3157211 RepID=UPI0033FBA67E
MTALTDPPPRLLSRSLLLVSAVDVLGLTAFYALLPVVPAAMAASGAGGAAAGLTTGVLMASTVAAELVLPRVVARFGYRAVVAAGLLLLGLPALGLTATTAFGAVLAVCALRGIGAATIFVACGAWSAQLLPPGRRGEGLGLVGFVSGVPAVVGMPAGLWLAAHAGFPTAYATGAVLALTALLALPLLPGTDGVTRRPPAPPDADGVTHRPPSPPDADRVTHRPPSPPDADRVTRRPPSPSGADDRDAGGTTRGVPSPPGADGRAADGMNRGLPSPAADGMMRALREPVLTRPAIVFGGACTLAGIVATFLPAALPHAGAGVVATALLLQALTGTVTRWWAGRVGDRVGPRRLLAPAMLAATAGFAGLAVTDRPVAVLAAAVVFGTGFGALQTASLAVMLDAAPPERYGTITALWSVAYDGGLGVGAAGFGLLATATGYPAGFAVTAALAATTLLALRRRTVRVRAT